MKKIFLLVVAVLMFSPVVFCENAKDAKDKGKNAKQNPAKDLNTLTGTVLEKFDEATKTKIFVLKTAEYGEVTLPDPKTLNPNSVITVDDYKRFINKNIKLKAKYEVNKDSKAVVIKEISNILPADSK